MKKLSRKIIRTALFIILLMLSVRVNVFSQTFTFYQCAEVVGTNHATNNLAVRMNGLHGSIQVNNTGGSAKTYTVVIKNVDPDFVFLNAGTVTAKGTNTLTFTWSITAGLVQTIWINPWYLTPWNFYFVAWGDSQHRPTRFQRLLAKSALINPVLSVAAGDCVQHGDDGGCIGCGNQNPAQPVTDQIYQNYLALFNDYPTPVFEALGNHDITRGGWQALDDSNYGQGERLWRKYMGATEYSFTVHPGYTGGGIHFLINRFYYDMPNWNSRHYFGGCTPNAYLRFDNNDSVGVAISNFTEGALAANQTAAARISVTHHGFSMFIPDHNTVENARALYEDGNVDYMIFGHAHTYGTGTDSPSGIPFLRTGVANGDNTGAGNSPGFSLVNVNNGAITEDYILADNLNLAVNYTQNGATQTVGRATITCSGYALPFVRLKFKLSNANAVYQAVDSATGADIPTYCRQFSDYTVVYVETSIGNGATRKVRVNAVPGLLSAMAKTAANEGLEDNDKDYTLFPNPAKGQATLKMPAGKQEYHVVMFDMSGRPLKEWKTWSGSLNIPLAGLPHGVYVLKISSGDKHLASKRLMVD